MKKFYFLRKGTGVPWLILAETEEQAAIEVANTIPGGAVNGQLFSEEDWFDYREKKRHSFPV